MTCSPTPPPSQAGCGIARSICRYLAEPGVTVVIDRDPDAARKTALVCSRAGAAR
jgi:hypothetical protein